MVKLGGVAVLLTAVTFMLTACGSADEPAPHETLDPATLERFNNAALDCLDGDGAACNRLRDMARTRDKDYELIGATCGRTLDEPLEYGQYCDVP